MLNVGDKAPEFSLKNNAGEEVTLSDLKGKTVVLYFYPKDNTPGCTKEACDFRDKRAAFSKKKAVIFGVSADSESSHKNFKDKFKLPFDLLSDPDKKTIQDYGVWVEKTNYGKTYMGIERATFVIGPDGRIQEIFRKVKVDGHIDAILLKLSASA